MKTARLQTWTPILLVILAGIAALLPMIFLGIASNNDLPNHYHFALPFYEQISAGDIYPGWLASTNFGYGDPVSRFYPPALYYLFAVARAVTGNWYTASLCLLTLLSVLGSLGAYFWARSFLPNHIAAWAGALYAFMPYRVAEIYQAAQLAEYAAGAALLFAFGFLRRVCLRGRSSDVAGLAISYAFLILSHLPLAVFGSLALVVYGLLSIDWSKYRTTVAKLVFSVSLGLAGSAFYWVRMITELRWILADGVHPDAMLDYRANFVFSTFSAEKSVTLWWMSILMIATLAMVLPSIVALVKMMRHPTPGVSEKVDQGKTKEIKAACFVGLFSVLMATAISKPLWAMLPFLKMAQHPFRWLAVTSAVAPILMAASIPFWFKWARGRTRPVTLVAAGIVAISLTFTLSQTIRGANYLSRSEFDQMLHPVKEAPSINQWLPVWASESAKGKPAYEKCDPPKGHADRIEAADRTIKIDSWYPQRRDFRIEAGPAAEARVSTFYYPHWLAFANGKSLVTHPGSDGALMVALPAEAASVNLEFREPVISKAAAILSLLAWIAIGAKAILCRRRHYHARVVSSDSLSFVR